MAYDPMHVVIFGESFEHKTILPQWQNLQYILRPVFHFNKLVLFPKKELR